MDATHGHFRGSAAVGEPKWSHFVEGLLTIDGEARLHFGGPGLAGSPLSGAGIPLHTDPLEQMQFVGHVTWNGDSGNGVGTIIGESCVLPADGRWCGVVAAADLTLEHVDSRLVGELRVDTPRGAESWPIQFAPWSIYYGHIAAAGRPSGVLTEQFAPFAKEGTVVVNVDDSGRFFFQSAATGCTGNGSFAPHADGRFAVFDVTLTIESCNAVYADFNREFQGLGTTTQSSYWDYDSSSVMLLSTPPGTRSAALMLLSNMF
jgi:hypothetical protein